MSRVLGNLEKIEMFSDVLIIRMFHYIGEFLGCYADLHGTSEYIIFLIFNLIRLHCNVLDQHYIPSRSLCLNRSDCPDPPTAQKIRNQKQIPNITQSHKSEPHMFLTAILGVVVMISARGPAVNSWSQ